MPHAVGICRPAFVAASSIVSFGSTWMLLLLLVNFIKKIVSALLVLKFIVCMVAGMFHCIGVKVFLEHYTITNKVCNTPSFCYKI